jgi:hypothetical protein
MSTSMAVQGGGFAIVASDTRTTNLETGTIDDNNEKVFRYSLGWVANSGGVATQSLLFRDYLNYYVHDTRHKIYILWLKSVKTTLDLAGKYGVKETDPETNSTQCFLSIGPGEINSIDFKYGRRRLTGNSVIFNPPKETKRIKALVAKYSKEPADMFEAIHILACFLHELSRLTKWVSDTLDCGIVIRLNDETLFMRLRADTKEIKRAYKNKTLTELMIVEAVKPTTKEALNS